MLTYIAPQLRPLRFVVAVAAVLVLAALYVARPPRRQCHCHRVKAPLIVHQHQLLAVPRDAWNRPLHLVCPSRHNRADPCDVTSAGADGLFGTRDDINSWEL